MSTAIYILFIGILTLFHLQDGYAQQIMISAEGTPLEAYQVAIARHPHAESFATHWLRNRTREVSRQRLRSLISDAEEAFLKDGLDHARMKYELVFNSRIEDDWSTSDISGLRYATLRRAQIAEDDGDQMVWLKRAAHLHTPEPLNEEVFPPPLLAKYRAILKQMRAVPLNLQSQFPWGDFLLVDGRVFPVTRSTRVLRDGLSHRFTVVSNRFAPVTEVLTWTGFQTWKPKPDLLVTGNCKESLWHPSLRQLPSKAVIWPSACVQDVSLEQTKIALPSEPKLHRPKSTEATIKRRSSILTIGLGVALAAVAYNHYEQNTSRKIIPSDRDGF